MRTDKHKNACTWMAEIPDFGLLLSSSVHIAATFFGLACPCSNHAIALRPHWSNSGNQKERNSVLKRCHRNPNLNTSLFFCINYAGTPGISRQKSQDTLPKRLVSLGFEGHTEHFGPHPSTLCWISQRFCACESSKR